MIIFLGAFNKKMKTWNKKLWSIQNNRSYVTKKSGWCKLQNIKREWKNVNGVYLFANKNKVVKYVGYAGSSNLKKEALSSIMIRNKSKGATLAMYVQCSNKKSAKKLETELKHLYSPINNNDI